MLKIAVYVSPSKVVKKTTGVGKHTVEMIKALSKEDKVSVILFGSYELQNNPDYVFRDIEFLSLPFKVKFLELSWKIFKAPNVDKFLLKWMQYTFPVRNMLSQPTLKYFIRYMTHINSSNIKLI